ncbi:YsnF/AvaK domain-containing protein [Marinilactibacillus sp. XAAS-LB27]|uniref:YsnF/AvaK domain-containing protein n=1 Tax=Marinilactibacillus sp. XAAS-LB27 TaxID=3114538 RepID=UPI002E18C0C5|nr:YsnF/AvaK domain-containing protein [Marinilactibacillus sp. XAAS-LB27]
MTKYVQGTYVTADEANTAVDSLIAQGYDSSDITLVSNDATNSNLSTNVHTKVYANSESEDESFMDKVKDMFTGDENDSSNNTTDSENDVLNRYTDEINNGRIVVLVEENPDVDRVSDDASLEPVGDTTVDPTMDSSDVIVGSTTDPSLDPTVDPTLDTTNEAALNSVDREPEVDATSTDSSKEKIQLQEEQVDVDTNEVQTGEVHVQKNVTEDTKTIEVPVKHEEVTVEKHAVTDGRPAENTLDDSEEISIPVTEEQIEVTKRPVVTDEVVINKETKEDTKQVSETVRKEDVDINTDGNVDVEDEKNDGFNNRP